MKKEEMNRLTIELVPSTAFYTNARKILSEDKWDIIRKETYKKFAYRCGICYDRGAWHPVECHEIWNYNDKTHIQTLEGLIALCPSCHKVKHIGLSKIRGDMENCVEHLMLINQITKEEVKEMVDKAFDVWLERSKHEWKCDISFLNRKKG